MTTLTREQIIEMVARGESLCGGNLSEADLTDQCPDCDGDGWYTLDTLVMTPDGPTERRVRCACWRDHDNDSEIEF